VSGPDDHYGPLWCAFDDCAAPVFAIDEHARPVVGWCAEHFPLVVDRMEALALHPGLRESLPPLHENQLALPGLD
jgi:hypothetical protein